jgi:hypothetical protein
MKKLDIEKVEVRKSSDDMTVRPVLRPVVQTQTRKPKGHFWARFWVVFIVVVSISFAGYFYYKLHSLERNNPTALAQRETKDLLGKVARIYLIPIGEEPTIATVSDPSALKSQAFFAEAQKGDKVLIFTKAGKAVLYRPSIDKIIETAPINIDTTKQNATPPPTTTGPLKDKTF